MSRAAFFVVAPLALLLADQAGQTPEYVNAGVLPYSMESGEARVLLGFDPDEEVWSDFVGVCTPRESPAQTASREFVEETREAYPQANVMQRLEDTAPVVIGPTWIYPLEVPEISAIQLGRLTKSRNSEKIAYCWVPLEALLASIDDRGAGGARVPASCGQSSPDLFELTGRNLEEGRELRARLLGSTTPPEVTDMGLRPRCGR